MNEGSHLASNPSKKRTGRREALALAVGRGDPRMLLLALSPPQTQMPSLAGSGTSRAARPGSGAQALVKSDGSRCAQAKAKAMKGEKRCVQTFESMAGLLPRFPSGRGSQGRQSPWLEPGHRLSSSQSPCLLLSRREPAAVLLTLGPRAALSGLGSLCEPPAYAGHLGKSCWLPVPMGPQARPAPSAVGT